MAGAGTYVSATAQLYVIVGSIKNTVEVFAHLECYAALLGSTETLLTANQRYVTSPNSQDLNNTAEEACNLANVSE
jgi:hypothetical protein